MFEKGEVVYHNDLVFINNFKDTKIDRPCIVLFELIVGSELYVCTCPLTNQVRTFNKHPGKYMLIPDTIYNYHKLSFAKLDCFVLKKASETHKTNIFVNHKTTDKLIVALSNTNNDEYEILRNYIEQNKGKLLSQKEKIKKKTSSQNKRKAV